MLQCSKVPCLKRAQQGNVCRYSNPFKLEMLTGLDHNGYRHACVAFMLLLALEMPCLALYSASVDGTSALDMRYSPTPQKGLYSGLHRGLLCGLERGLYYTATPISPRGDHGEEC